MAETSAVKKRGLQYLCCTPDEYCHGKPVGDHRGAADKTKTHSTVEQVFSCQANYFLKLGYIRLSRREFQAPNGGPIMVLSKKPIRAKAGKENRYMSQLLTRF